MRGDPFDKPSHVEARQGVVFVHGPDGAAISLTPDAAAETSDRLLQGAVMARGQQLAIETEAARRKRLA